MKVTKNMVNEELRGMFWPMRFLAFMLSKVSVLKLMNKLSARSRAVEINELHCEEIFIPSRNGGPGIRTRIFKPLNAAGELPGMLYIHGGGYVIGRPEEFIDIIKNFIDAKPCVIIAPDYRKALEAPYPAAFNDCYDTLLWMKDNAEALGIISDQFIIGGHSAGGGLTAAVTLKAADTKDVNVAFQMPIYPMIDDRQLSESAVNSDAPVWNSKSNELGWRLYLSDLKDREKEIPSYAAPSRGTDYSKLPPTITFVGDLEPFRDETIAYVENLKKAGIKVDFEMYKGCFHGFDRVAPGAEITRAANHFLFSRYSDYVDEFVVRNN
jgi:acetyl esterase/lipase